MLCIGYGTILMHLKNRRLSSPARVATFRRWPR
jgi:hypothetical protein